MIVFFFKNSREVKKLNLPVWFIDFFEAAWNFIRKWSFGISCLESFVPHFQITNDNFPYFSSGLNVVALDHFLLVKFPERLSAQIRELPGL